MKRVSGTVTMGDIQTFFKGVFNKTTGDRWRPEVDKDGEFWASSNRYNVNMFPKGMMYAVEIASIDDPSDSDNKVTDKPIEFIAEFMGTGTSGDDYFKQMSSSPEDIAFVLRRLAFETAAEKIGPRKLAKILRRAIIRPELHLVRKVVVAFLKIADSRSAYKDSDLEDLKNEMSKKGWQVEIGKNKRDMPVLTVNIGGAFEAKISIDHIIWDYTYKLNGTDVVDSGVTDDPIKSFQTFYKSEPVKEAISSMSSGEDSKSEPDSDKVTKPARPKSEPNEGTIPARKM